METNNINFLSEEKNHLNSYKFDIFGNLLAESVDDLIYDKFIVNRNNIKNMNHSNITKKNFSSDENPNKAKKIINKENEKKNNNIKNNEITKENNKKIDNIKEINNNNSIKLTNKKVGDETFNNIRDKKEKGYVKKYEKNSELDEKSKKKEHKKDKNKNEENKEKKKNISKKRENKSKDKEKKEIRIEKVDGLSVKKYPIKTEEKTIQVNLNENKDKFEIKKENKDENSRNNKKDNKLEKNQKIIINKRLKSYKNNLVLSGKIIFSLNSDNNRKSPKVKIKVTDSNMKIEYSTSIVKENNNANNEKKIIAENNNDFSKNSRNKQDIKDKSNDSKIDDKFLDSIEEKFENFNGIIKQNEESIESRDNTLECNKVSEFIILANKKREDSIDNKISPNDSKPNNYCKNKNNLECEIKKNIGYAYNIKNNKSEKEDEIKGVSHENSNNTFSVVSNENYLNDLLNNAGVKAITRPEKSRDLNFENNDFENKKNEINNSTNCENNLENNINPTFDSIKKNENEIKTNNELINKNKLTESLNLITNGKKDDNIIRLNFKLNDKSDDDVKINIRLNNDQNDEKYNRKNESMHKKESGENYKEKEIFKTKDNIEIENENTIPPKLSKRNTPKNELNGSTSKKLNAVAGVVIEKDDDDISKKSFNIKVNINFNSSQTSLHSFKPIQNKNENLLNNKKEIKDLIENNDKYNNKDNNNNIINKNENISNRKWEDIKGNNKERINNYNEDSNNYKIQNESKKSIVIQKDIDYTENKNREKANSNNINNTDKDNINHERNRNTSIVKKENNVINGKYNQNININDLQEKEELFIYNKPILSFCYSLKVRKETKINKLISKKNQRVFVTKTYHQHINDKDVVRLPNFILCYYQKLDEIIYIRDNNEEERNEILPSIINDNYFCTKEILLPEKKLKINNTILETDKQKEIKIDKLELKNRLSKENKQSILLTKKIDLIAKDNSKENNEEMQNKTILQKSKNGSAILNQEEGKQNEEKKNNGNNQKKNNNKNNTYGGENIESEKNNGDRDINEPGNDSRDENIEDNEINSIIENDKKIGRSNSFIENNKIYKFRTRGPDIKITINSPFNPLIKYEQIKINSNEEGLGYSYNLKRPKELIQNSKKFLDQENIAKKNINNENLNNNDDEENNFKSDEDNNDIYHQSNFNNNKKSSKLIINCRNNNVTQKLKLKNNFRLSSTKTHLKSSINNNINKKYNNNLKLTSNRYMNNSINLADKNYHLVSTLQLNKISNNFTNYNHNINNSKQKMNVLNTGSYVKHFGKVENCPVCIEMMEKAKIMIRKMFDINQNKSLKGLKRNESIDSNLIESKNRNKYIKFDEEKNANMKNKILAKFNESIYLNNRRRLQKNRSMNDIEKDTNKRNKNIKNSSSEKYGNSSEVEFPAINSYFRV